jgi:transcriptional regulator with XRE-family HTH domain
MITMLEICLVKKTKSKHKPITREEGLKKLAARIKQLRVKNGYSSYENFSYEVDISRAQFGRYEKGGDIRFSSLLKIINGLDMTIEEFFSEGFK